MTTINPLMEAYESPSLGFILFFEAGIGGRTGVVNEKATRQKIVRKPGFFL